MRLQAVIKFSVALVGFVSAAVVLGLWSNVTQALTISPVLVELSPDRRITSITISNPADHPVSFQTQILAWSQSEGTDVYAESDELIVVPPIAEVGAGESQIFRVTFRAAPGPQERAYRLIFEDVTDMVSAAQAAGEPRIDIRINHSLPVFITARGKALAQPRLGSCASLVQATTATSRCIRLDNDGNHYVQIKSLTVAGTDWRKTLNSGARVLAGAWRQWTFDVPPHAVEDLIVQADTSGGVVTFTLPSPARY
jgi:fimbrial chaperone protein